MRHRYAVVAAFVLAVVAAGVVTLAGANPFAEDSEKVCPEGQQLVNIKAGDAVLHNDKAPPPGMYFKDSVSGSGPSYTVRSDGDSASVEGDVPLAIKCR